MKLTILCFITNVYHHDWAKTKYSNCITNKIINHQQTDHHPKCNTTNNIIFLNPDHIYGECGIHDGQCSQLLRVLSVNTSSVLTLLTG